MKITNRLSNLRRKFAEKGLDGVLISQPDNRFYLSGFNGSAGWLLVTANKATLATDFRYIEQAKQKATGFEIFKVTGDTAEWLPKLMAGFSLKRLGFEADYMTVAAYHKIRDMLGRFDPPVSLVPVEGMVDALRAVKDAEELELISRAAAITDAAYAHVEKVARPGMTELELAWEIEKFMRESGSQSVPFDLIVAAGPNAALPHAHPSTRVINEGEPVVIDIGSKVEGYSSDETRTICLGEPTDQFKKIYDIVLGAQLTAIAIIKDGMTGEQADALARKVIEEAGYGEAFGHSLGHGVGLATHEFPRLGPKSADVLTPGMVFTIEPGIYLPEWGGVRIEDLGVLEDGKVKLISKADKVSRKGV
ncbi:MAG: aminopeptidase P family protein [Dehalococcoidales bacterium]|nr:aminopeptidase P family protein [Dehalococcoidales bacterium]